MTPYADAHSKFHFESSARRDIRFWALLIVGAFFLAIALSVDPSENCDSSGDCAPILVLVARAFGALAVMIAVSYLWVDQSRGCQIDPVTGDLMWWQGRTKSQSGKAGRINPRDISIVRIDRMSESSDEIHLYDKGGERQPYFDANVLPWWFEKWLAEFAVAYPHIVIEDRE